MADTTYFVFIENSPLNNPDNGSNPITGFVSSNKIPSTSPGDGEYRPDQALDLSNCTSLSEKTTNTGGREILVSWLIRSTVNEYGVTKLIDKKWTPDPVEISGDIADYWVVGKEIDEELTISGGTGIYSDIIVDNKPLWLTIDVVGDKIIFSGSSITSQVGEFTITIIDNIGTTGTRIINFEILGELNYHLSGGFSSVNGLSQFNRCVKLNANFELDGSFAPQITNGTILSHYVNNQGKIFLSGTFTQVNGEPRNKIVKLNSDGTTDSSFSFDYTSTSNTFITETSSGDILYCGNVTGEHPRHLIVKLNAAGELDTTFDASSSANNTWSKIVEQPDLKLLVCGNSNTGRLRRLLSETGQLDNTFTPIGLNNTVLDICLDTDGKMVIVGYFTGVAGGRNRICRLNPDGTLDTTFFATLPTNGQVVIPSRDGGYFVGCNGSGGIIKLHYDGTVDSSFSMSLIGSGGILSMMEDVNGKIVFYGQYDTVNGVPNNSMVRLNPDGSTDSTIPITGLTGLNTLSYTTIL